MTAIAIMTLPISIMACCACLYFTGQTINVMTLAGMTLAIGPMIDSAIICLENTHRHLGLGATTHEAAFLGASEVAMPELVSTLCTFLVLSPLVLTPGLGQFLFKPMAMAVAFSMIAAYILSRTLVPACSAFWLKSHGAGHGHASGGHGAGGHAASGHGTPRTVNTQPMPLCIGRRKLRPSRSMATETAAQAHAPRRAGAIRRAFARWEQMIETGIGYYVKGLDGVLKHPILTIAVAFGLLAGTPGDHVADHAPRFLPRGRRRRVRDVRPRRERHAHREDRATNQGGRRFRPEDDRKRRPPADSFGDRRHFRLVGRLHPERRADGCGRQDSALRGAFEIGPGVCPYPADSIRTRHAVQRPRVCIRRRRHGSLGHERRPIDADLDPRDREGPEESPTRSRRRSR